MAKILEVKDLCVSVDGKTILENINLTVNSGEIHVLMGPNGAGKSTLMNAIMAHPKYKIESGSIFFQGEDITEQKADERARKGIFMSFQNPEEIQGVSVEEFIKEALNSQGKDYNGALKFHKELVNKMDNLKILDPKLCMLDETDSGLDVDAVKVVSQSIKDYFNDDKAIIIITHHKEIMANIIPNFVHVLKDGKIVKTSDASLINEIEENGYTNL